MIVMKFGGTSLGSPNAFAQVAEIIAQEHSKKNRQGVIVVTSAMKDVTSKLIESAQAAAAGDEEPFHTAKSFLLDLHQPVAYQLIENEAERSAVDHIVDNLLKDFERLCHSIAVLGELTARGLDVISGLGERLSAPLLACVLQARGLNAQFVDAGELIITDNMHGAANPIIKLTTQCCRKTLLPLLQNGVIPVVNGFVGTTVDGVPTTLGRGGSDYSAAILGAVLAVEEIQIWTDVNGVLTADPRIVTKARSLEELSYEEMAELAYYGANVLHPKSVRPAVQNNIPLRVLNTFNPTHPGTRIMKRVTGKIQSTVKAITAIRNMNLITVAGRGMIGVPGIAARTFSSVARMGVNVLMISQSSSEQNICFIVPDNDAALVLAALNEEFVIELQRHFIEKIWGLSDIVIVAVVGSAMKGTPGIAARIFNALGTAKINVIAIAQGASEANISLVVSDNNLNEAVRVIHDAFELERQPKKKEN
ncbi:MAG: aspartate kinase [bacterium]